jgi:hypothetical protein
MLIPSKLEVDLEQVEHNEILQTDDNFILRLEQTAFQKLFLGINHSSTIFSSTCTPRARKNLELAFYVDRGHPSFAI